MGMFTEFHYNVELKKDTPKEVLKILRYMLDNSGFKDSYKLELPDHPLFKNSERWTWMLLSDSYYFSADTHSTLRFDDPIAKVYYLCIRCNLKNYNHEIENFIDWIDPYVRAESGNFLGFYRYEESEEPTIVRKK